MVVVLVSSSCANFLRSEATDPVVKNGRFASSFSPLKYRTLQEKIASKKGKENIASKKGKFVSQKPLFEPPGF